MMWDGSLHWTNMSADHCQQRNSSFTIFIFNFCQKCWRISAALALGGGREGSVPTRLFSALIYYYTLKYWCRYIDIFNILIVFFRAKKKKNNSLSWSVAASWCCCWCCCSGVAAADVVAGVLAERGMGHSEETRLANLLRRVSREDDRDRRLANLKQLKEFISHGESKVVSAL